MAQAPPIGIGRALQKARGRRGLTLEDAGRGTRLRPDFLAALEREAFEALPGDVYVRGFLRSYASYLGLNPSKVMGVYDRAHGETRPRPAPVDRSPALAASEDVALPGTRRHFPWPMAAGVTIIALIVAGAAGLLSRSASTPEPAPPDVAPAVAAAGRGVQVDLVALREVDIRVTVDGAIEFEGHLLEEEARSFVADEQISLWLQYGRSVELTVNGKEAGRPGPLTEPYQATYDASSFRGERSPAGR